MGSLSKDTASARKPTVLTFAMLWLLTACACMICFAPVIDTYSPLSIGADTDDGLRHLVGRGDDLRIGLEGPLLGDHIHELRGQIYVRTLERAGGNAAEPGGTRD